MRPAAWCFGIPAELWPQPVAEHHNVRSPVVLRFDHRELVHHQPVIRLRIGEIHQAHMIARDGTVGPFVFHFHAIAQAAYQHHISE
jgi:hypothetical protein